MLGQGADERLDDEEPGDDEDEPRDDALRLGQTDLAGLTEGQGGGLLGVPADPPAPPAVDGEHDAGAADQDGQ